MNASIDFNAWLVQPGNHRMLRQLNDALRNALMRKVEIHSWRDLYQTFEESVTKSEPTRALFSPIIDVCPPSKETGATTNQIMIYRGAQVDHETAYPQNTNTVSVTYRGQKVEKTIGSSQDDTAVMADKPARYYRGVRVE